MTNAHLWSQPGGRLTLTLDRVASVRYLRRMVATWEVVLGTVGGLMSIFVGFSFVCIAELIYFFTLREAAATILCSTNNGAAGLGKILLKCI